MQDQKPTFHNLGIAPKMLQVLERLKFVTPTPVQYAAIPIMNEGKDVVAVAQTGTGKTLAFGVPIVQLLAKSDGQALILAPTRDLVLQVNEVFKTILHPFRMTSVVLIGGMPMHRQVQQMRRRPQVIVATPGRLLDHMERGTVRLGKVKILILDEADRMLDMGFAPQVNRILKAIPKQRQTALFSATMPEKIVSLATKSMKLPIHVEIAPPGKTPQEVTQELFIVREDNKRKLLSELLKEYRGSVLLFIRTKAKTKKVTKYLNNLGHRAVEIHSDRSMSQRRMAIEGFKAGRFRLLVATDVAARGIDIKNIELVINFDIPDDIENYIHRIGRTGRAGMKGHAITFAAPDQGKDVRDIETMIKKTIPKAVHETLSEQYFDKHSRPAAKKGRGGGGFRPRGRKSSKKKTFRFRRGRRRS